MLSANAPRTFTNHFLHPAAIQGRKLNIGAAIVKKEIQDERIFFSRGGAMKVLLG
jgi:hypothetical protein